MLETQFRAETKTSSLNGAVLDSPGVQSSFLNAGGVQSPFDTGGRMHSHHSSESMLDLEGHARQLFVNKVGRTMFPPPKDAFGFVPYRQLFNRHRLKTVTYCAVFWSFGMCVAFLGPTLLDLECRISSVFSTISWIFFSQSLFTLVGSACGGCLVTWIGSHPTLLVSIFMLSLTLGIIPSCSLLGELTAVLAVMGFFMGTVDTVANISMIQLYGRNVAPFLQALHFFYGLGASLSPMIAEPFLLNKNCTKPLLNRTRARLSFGLSDNSSFPIDELVEAQQESKIQYAFWIMSAMQTPIIALLLVVVVRDTMGWSNEVNIADQPFSDVTEAAGKNSYELQNSAGHQPTRSQSLEVGVSSHTDDRPPVTKEQIVLITICTGATLFIYDGLQSGFGGYIFSYAVKSIAGMSMNEAAYLNACFWGTFAFGRLLSIGISTRLAPHFMLICNIAGCLFAMILMLSFRHNHAVLYVGTCIFGTFLSSVYPTSVSLAEMYINLTSYITSILVVCAASGEMILPVIIGHEFDIIGPSSVLISGVIMTVLSLFLYIFLYLVAQTIVRQSSDPTLLGRIKHVLRPPTSGEINEDSGFMKHHMKYYSRMRSDVTETSLEDINTTVPIPNSFSKKAPDNL